MMIQESKSKIKIFLSNPIVVLIGYSIGIAGLIFAIFVFFENKARRELISYLYPAKAVIYKSGQISTLEVLFNNKKISSDVTAVQIALWNKGKKAIESDDILEGIKILTEPRTAILDAEIRKITRDVTGLKINENFLAEGYVPVCWKILEKNDGGIIQLILNGDPETKVLVKGIIKEPYSIRNIDLSKKIKGALEQIKSESKSNKFTGYLLLFFSAGNLIGLILGRRKIRRIMGRKFLIFWVLLPIITFGFSLYIIIFFVKEIGPPFGF